MAGVDIANLIFVSKGVRDVADQSLFEVAYKSDNTTN